MPFKKGEPRPPNAGRKKGSPNATTKAVKAALHEAFDRLGGVPALVAWGTKNPTEFYRLWVRLLPTELKASVDGQVAVRIVEEVVGPDHVPALD